MDQADAAAHLTRNAEHVVPADELAGRIASGRPLRVKLGVDPTAGHVTLGWGVPLRKLRHFQDAGHIAVLIIGDFTARIGDPSGKSATRPQLTKEDVDAYARDCLGQLGAILRQDNLEVRYNSEWLDPMGLHDVLRLASQYTIARMLERDDFARRYSDGRPIAIHEFLYPLLQGYDSVAVRADVELGGTDQLFNLLVGRDLQKAAGQEPQIALTMPLLVGLDGVNKMSQSLGNYIGTTDEPADMFGKIMSVPDSLVGQYARLAAWLDDDDADALERAAASGGAGAGEAKRRVAGAVVALYHGDAAAADAEASFDRVFRDHDAPEDVPEAAIPEAAVADGTVHLPKLIAALRLAQSRAEARRLLAQGAVRIDGRRIEGEDVPLDSVAGALLQVGRRRFVRLAPGR